MKANMVAFNIKRDTVFEVIVKENEVDFFFQDSYDLDTCCTLSIQDATRLKDYLIKYLP